MSTYFKTLNTGSIASGSTATVNWTPDTNIKIKKMMIVERSDQSLSNVQAAISIANVPFTKDFVPASVIGQDPEFCYKPDVDVSQGASIAVTLANNSGAAVDCDVVFEVE